MHISRILRKASFPIFLLPAAFAQSAADVPFQVHYFSNVISTLPVTGTPGTTNTVINMTNTGSSVATTFHVNTGGPITLGPCSTLPPAESVVGNGNICINAYVLSPDEELQACCTCFLTPNQLSSWDVAQDLTSNPADGKGIPSGVIKLVATLGGTDPTSCDATLAGLPTNFTNTFEGVSNSDANSVLAPGMLAWSRGQIPLGSTRGIESLFSPATLTSGYATPTPSITATGVAVANGALPELGRLNAQCSALISGVGICNTCRPGGL